MTVLPMLYSNRNLPQLFSGYWQLQNVSVTVRVTWSGKYKQNLLYLKLLRVENIIQTNTLHISSSFQAVLEFAPVFAARRDALWDYPLTRSITSQSPLRAAIDIPDIRSLSFLFRGGCATFIPEENLVGFIKLIHTAIRPQSHFNLSTTCLLSSILTRLKLVG